MAFQQAGTGGRDWSLIFKRSFTLPGEAPGGWGEAGAGSSWGSGCGHGRPGGLGGGQGSPHPRNTWHRWPAGKYAALDVEATRPLLQLLTSSLSKARLNAIKALTMLAEAPEGRKLLQPHVATFRALEEDFSPAVQRAAQIAIRVIEWKP